jgi:hypothetical protein
MNTSSGSSLYSLRDNSLSRQPSIDYVPEDEHAMRQRASTSASPSSSPVVGPDHSRGRKSARFSFANVLIDAVKDQVRSISPRTRTSRDATVSGERSRGRATSPRGRSVEPKKDQGNQHQKSSLGKFGDMLKLDSQEKEAGDGWKEFKKGAFSSNWDGNLH